MTTTGPVTCSQFDEAAEELAVGAIGEPDRSRLLDHASGCGRCGPLLNELSLVADQLLAFGPEVEPPTGFEIRAVAGMPSVSTAGSTAGTRPAARAVRLVAAAAVIVVALAAGGLVGRETAGSQHLAAGTARQGAILSATGTRLGTVTLDSGPRPHVLIALDRPKPGPGQRTCQLEMPGGTWVSVGGWTYNEIDTGVWAIGIDRGMLGARAMRITDDGGDVVATAQFG